jgi:site-specific DNA recombinase
MRAFTSARCSASEGALSRRSSRRSSAASSASLIRSKAGETKSRLVPDPEQAPVVAEIFALWMKGLGVTAIADLLNEREVPSPTATNPRLNSRSDWAKSTLHSLLRNPTYTGKAVWDRLDNATRRELGGTAPRRAEDEWIVCEAAHESLVSDELFASAQDRLRTKSKATGHPRRGQPVHLLSGMVRCASGHASLSAYGNVAKGHTYYRCSYGVDYGRVAAAKIEGHGVSCNCREDLLLPFVERFFSERVFGPMRLDLLAEQLDVQAQASRSDGKAARARLSRKLIEIDAALAAQVRGLEAGIDTDLVGARIAELKAERATAQAALAVLLTDDAPDPTERGAALERLPNLTDALSEASPATKRQVFDAFDLRCVYDKLDGRVEISATITEAVADLLQEPGDLALCGGLLRGWDSNPQP